MSDLTGLPAGGFNKAPAGSVNNLIAFQKYCDFINYFEAIVDRFPAREKYALCTNIKKCLYDTMELFIVTNRSRDKPSGWFSIDTKLEILRFYVRRCHSKGSQYISNNSYEVASKKLSEIGRIIGGLINDITKKG